MTEEKFEVGTLKVGEIHPSARIAYAYIKYHPKQFILLESLSSLALSENRLSEVCSETLRRLMNDEPVSDRYLMGLYILILELEKSQEFNKRMEIATR